MLRILCGFVTSFLVLKLFSDTLWAVDFLANAGELAKYAQHCYFGVAISYRTPSGRKLFLCKQSLPT